MIIGREQSTGDLSIYRNYGPADEEVPSPADVFVAARPFSVVEMTRWRDATRRNVRNDGGGRSLVE
jgi:hypothetical protein